MRPGEGSSTLPKGVHVTIKSMAVTRYPQPVVTLSPEPEFWASASTGQSRAIPLKPAWWPARQGMLATDLRRRWRYTVLISSRATSVGGDLDGYWEDSIAIGAFHAVKKGISVAVSAGNSRPTEGSVTNVAPWLITVAASK